MGAGEGLPVVCDKWVEGPPETTALVRCSGLRWPDPLQKQVHLQPRQGPRGEVFRPHRWHLELLEPVDFLGKAKVRGQRLASQPRCSGASSSQQAGEGPAAPKLQTYGSFLGQKQCLQVEFTDPGLLEPGHRGHQKLAAEDGAHAFLTGIPEAPPRLPPLQPCFSGLRISLALSACISAPDSEISGRPEVGWPGPLHAYPLVRAGQHHQNHRTLGNTGK